MLQGVWDDVIYVIYIYIYIRYICYIYIYICYICKPNLHAWP